MTIYVDDILTIGPTHYCQEFLDELKLTFNIKELGTVKKLLGFEVSFHNQTITLSQCLYIEKLLHQFKMEDANPSRTPMEVKLDIPQDNLNVKRMHTSYQSLVGSLQYLITATRPELAYVVNYFSRFLSSSTPLHHKHLKRVLRYLIGTKHFGLKFDGLEARKIFRIYESYKIISYSDADYYKEKDGKSITGFVTYLNGQLVSGRSWKQQRVTESTSEAELVAANEAAKDALWLKQLLEIMHLTTDIITLYVDNKSALEIAKHPTSHKRNKHLSITSLKIREYIEEKLIEIKYVPSNENIADMFTKSLGNQKFQEFREKLGVQVCTD